MFIRFDVIYERDKRTDGQTDIQTLHDSKDRAYASHRAVKMEKPVLLNFRSIKLFQEIEPFASF